VFGIDRHKVETLDIIFLLKVKNSIVLRDPQAADDLLLELGYLYILIVARHSLEFVGYAIHDTICECILRAQPVVPVEILEDLL
jgi:hypothetical protein